MLEPYFKRICRGTMDQRHRPAQTRVQDGLRQGALSRPLHFDGAGLRRLFGLPVLKHRLKHRHYLREWRRCMETGGKLDLLKPKVSIGSTVALPLAGEQPSSGGRLDACAVLTTGLNRLAFREVSGHGFGLYPFPNWMQPMLERIDPYHCHQMVFIAEK